MTSRTSCAQMMYELPQIYIQLFIVSYFSTAASIGALEDLDRGNAFYDP